MPRSAISKLAPQCRGRLNHEGDKGRTQVKRALVKQTGIKYGAIDKAMATIHSTPATLTYRLKARGEETNIAWFGGVQRGKGVSAAPWNKRRIFAHSFIVPRFGRAFLRRSMQRLPIRGVYGPNIARELVKDSSAAAWHAGVANIVALHWARDWAHAAALTRRQTRSFGRPRQEAVRAPIAAGDSSANPQKLSHELAKLVRRGEAKKGPSFKGLGSGGAAAR